MTTNPPSLPAVVGGALQLNFDALNVRLSSSEAALAKMAAVISYVGGTALKFNSGKAECTFGGASVAASQIITHGLGHTPIFAAPIFEDAGYVPGAGTYGETTFVAQAQKRDGTSPAAGTKAPFHWIAIG